MHVFLCVLPTISYASHELSNQPSSNARDAAMQSNQLSAAVAHLLVVLVSNLGVRVGAKQHSNVQRAVCGGGGGRPPGQTPTRKDTIRHT